MDFEQDFKTVKGKNWKTHISRIEWADRYPVIDSNGIIIGWRSADDIPETAQLWAIYQNNKRRSFKKVSKSDGENFGFDAIEE
jgi:hypothetical protein